MPEILLSVRALPIDVITKQLDCCTARRIRGSMLVTWVSRPKLANHSLPRPSSTASVPSGESQRCRPLLALTLVLPPAEPDAAVGLEPVERMPPPAPPQAVRVRPRVRDAASAVERKREEWGVIECYFL